MKLEAAGDHEQHNEDKSSDEDQDSEKSRSYEATSVAPIRKLGNRQRDGRGRCDVSPMLMVNDNGAVPSCIISCRSGTSCFPFWGTAKYCLNQGVSGVFH
ncbi:hypothetical protein L1987_74265 [Smallanthus sonchifolius]|uniref:Uncharacterized protein n=1 Tax=Smallanthus sonchifolius TaxID=185202 RepID=A0ACB9A3S5_9ASTR|nr:hypothetical protein L1987_74265 [Smallanthus sonchifolius]